MAWGQRDADVNHVDAEPPQAKEYSRAREELAAATKGVGARAAKALVKAERHRWRRRREAHQE